MILRLLNLYCVKRAGAVALLLLATALGFGQVFNPVKWTWKAEEISKGEYKLVFKASIDQPWHTYSMFVGEGGPVPTSIAFTKNSSVQIVGKTTERGGKIHEGFDPVFGIQLKYFEDEMVCEQVVRVSADTKLKGSLEYMSCNDSRCLPPDLLDFEFKLKGNGAIAATNDNAKADTATAPVTVNRIDTLAALPPPDTANHGGACGFGKNGFTKGYFGEPLVDCGEQISTESYWDIILQGLIWGLIAVFMPCVFPMIPLTVSFFTKRAETPAKGRAEALFYAGSIIFIYVLCSMPFVLFGASQNSLNEFATSPWLNMGFFIVFVIFAISFFGFFEITLPSFLVNQTDKASGAGGYLGIFFMALTLVLVSFSCTGPILGTLIGNVYSSGGGKMKLIVGFASFGTAIAFPFALFSLFPSMMKKLPRSGGWMNTFKVILGFVELILALKFLTNADNVSHWGIMKREVFLGLWAVLGFGLFLYLIGVFTFAKEHSDGKISLGRYVLALVPLAFSAYSAWGVYCHDLKLFSGFPPPKIPQYSWCVDCKSECPLGLNCYHDYCEALEAAKRENKPIMLDFTGYACQICRKMEEEVWSQPDVYKVLSEKYIILSLYVDDRQALPESQQYYSTTLNKIVKTVGGKWSDLETTCFNDNSQPMYALISPGEKLLNSKRSGYNDAKSFLDWLNCGLSGMKK